MSHKSYISFCALLAALTVTVACGGGKLGSSNPGGSAGTGSAVAKSNFMNFFAAGISHASGNYGFTQENYLQEGAERIHSLGSESIFVYLTPSFRTTYPDKGSPMWPAQNPAQLSALAA